MYILLFDVFTSVKEKWLISTGMCILLFDVFNDLVQKTTQVATGDNTRATRHNTRQYETTRDNTRQHETTRVQHETTRVQHETTRDNTRQHEYNMRQQNNIKFILIYLYHCCILEAGKLGSKTLFML